LSHDDDEEESFSSSLAILERFCHNADERISWLILVLGRRV
jgi:hypothetical protein